MLVHLLFFGMLKELTGKSGESLELPEGASVADVLAECAAKVPRITEALPSLAVAVNRHYAGPATVLKSGDEVALLPPVSGGSADRRDAPTVRAPTVRAKIVREKIDTAQILANIKRGDDGAAAVFEGVVRNQTRGRRTLYLEYEAYEEMALHEMEALAERALEQFDVREVSLIHRLGRLEIGETSVLIVVASGHRAPAFAACRWLIDTLKQKVPIWKKEYFEDGAVWADGEAFPAEVPRANS
jgi:MoaE-MoaD fusion protein